MRRLLSVIALGCASFALFECVGEDPDSTQSSPDAASTTDGAASVDSSIPGSDSGEPVDGGVDSSGPSTCTTPAPSQATGKIQCVDAGCTGSTSKCCYAPGAGFQPGCFTSGASCPAFAFVCDKSSDCDGGQECCLSGVANTAGSCPFPVTATGGAACGAACTGGTMELCTPQETCADPQKHCVPVVVTVNASDASFTRTLGACL